MRTGSLRAATQADPGQRATSQKNRLARQGERPYRGRQAGPSGATARARKSAGGVEKSPPCGMNALNIATRMFSHNLQTAWKTGGVSTLASAFHFIEMRSSMGYG